MPLRILCDENIPNLAIVMLGQRGFKVLTLPAGSADAAVAKLAKQKKAVLLTFDSDFANILAYPPQDYYGIVRIKLKPPLAEKLTARLAVLFAEFKTAKMFRGRLIILESDTIRIWEHSPILGNTRAS